MDKTSIKNQIVMLTGAVIVLLAALVLGMGIRKLRLAGVFTRTEAPMQTHAVEPEAVIVAEAPPDSGKEDEWLEEQMQTVEPETVVAAEAPPDLSEEDEQLLLWLEGQMESATAQEEAVASAEYAHQETAESIEKPTDTADSRQGRATQGFGDWRNAWADLNLTEEEQTRLREGFRLAMERWQNMSEQERQARIEEMRAGWERWQNMSDEEREAANQRNRERFEQWRESGQAELPEMSLD